MCFVIDKCAKRVKLNIKYSLKGVERLKCSGKTELSVLFIKPKSRRGQTHI